MLDPLSLALPLAVHQQLVGHYIDEDVLDRPSGIDLVVARGEAPDTIAITYQIVEGDVACRGPVPSTQWGVLRCETPLPGAPGADSPCGESFEVDIRFVDGILQARARDACVAAKQFWPVAASFVKVNPLALALREYRGSHGGSETAAILGGALEMALGADPDPALRAFGMGAERALAAFGASPRAWPKDVVLPPSIFEEIGGGVLRGAMRCAGAAANGSPEDPHDCFLREAESHGAMAVYAALGQEAFGDACPTVRPKPLEPTRRSAAPDGGELRDWDGDGDGEIDYQEHWDPAGRLVTARTRVFVPEGEGPVPGWTLAPALSRVYDATGALLSEHTKGAGYERTLRYTRDAAGRVAHVEHIDGNRPGSLVYDAEWSAAGWLTTLTLTDTDPYVTATTRSQFTYAADSTMREDREQTRSDQPGITKFPPLGRRLLDGVPKALVASEVATGTSPLTVERDATGRLVKVSLEGGYERTWVWACGAGCKVEERCADPRGECRGRTYTCAGP